MARTKSEVIDVPVLSMTNMRRYRATLQGSGALLMNRRLLPGEEAQILEELGFAKKSKVAKEEIEQKLWRYKLYYNSEKGVYLPGENLHECFKAGAKFSNRSVPGDNKRKYASLLTAAMICQDMPLGNGKPLERDDPIIQEFGRYVNGNPSAAKKSQVWRIRPAIMAWEGVADFTVFDTRITKDALEEIIYNAGAFSGLGDWRPKFGRFHLTDLQEVK